VTYSNTFTKLAGAGVLVAGLAGCGTVSPPINQTVHEPAVSNNVVKISRCAENGFHVAQANAYNMAQVQQNNQNIRGLNYNNPLLAPFANTGISSQLLYTGNGPMIIQYPKSFRVNNEIFSKLAGGFAGGSIGGGYGRVVGAIFGVGVLGPLFESAADKLSGPAEIQKHIKLAECVSDTLAINGGPGLAPAGGERGYIGNPGPRPRY
jgi:hypothetical protein